MTKLKASKLQQRIHRQLADKGKILTQAQANQYAEAIELAIKQAENEVDRGKAKALGAKLRLHQQAHPIGARPKQPSNPSSPTPELRKKHELIPEQVAPANGPIPALNRHRRQRALQPYDPYFSVSEKSAFEAFYADAQAHTHYNITQNYNGVSGGSNGKIGGVGAQESLREKHVRFQWIKQHLVDIDPMLWRIAVWLVLELRHDEMERMPSVADVGGIMVPQIKDIATRRGISVGTLKVLAWVLRRMYRLDRAMSKHPGASARRVAQITTVPAQSRSRRSATG